MWYDHTLAEQQVVVISKHILSWKASHFLPSSCSILHRYHLILYLYHLLHNRFTCHYVNTCGDYPNLSTLTSTRCHAIRNNGRKAHKHWHSLFKLCNVDNMAHFLTLKTTLSPANCLHNFKQIMWIGYVHNNYGCKYVFLFFYELYLSESWWI